MPEVPSRSESTAAVLVLDPLGERLERGVHSRDHRGENLRRNVIAAECLGERDHAEAKQFPLGDPSRSSAPARHPDDLGRPAADVEQNGRFRVLVDQFATPGRRERGLGLAIDDFKVQPEPVAHVTQELGTVDGGPARLRGHQPRPRDAARAHFVAANTQRLHCTLDRRLGQRPVCDSPSPSRTIRENASMTRNPPYAGRAISRRQLFVPKSRAA